MAGASLAASTGTGLEVYDNVNFDVRYLADSEEVEFTAILADGTWFGVMLGSDRMAGTNDVIMFEANGDDSLFADTYVKGYGKPKMDDDENLTGEIS